MVQMGLTGPKSRCHRTGSLWDSMENPSSCLFLLLHVPTIHQASQPSVNGQTPWDHPTSLPKSYLPPSAPPPSFPLQLHRPSSYQSGPVYVGHLTSNLHPHLSWHPQTRQPLRADVHIRSHFPVCRREVPAHSL